MGGANFRDKSKVVEPVTRPRNAASKGFEMKGGKACTAGLIAVLSMGSGVLAAAELDAEAKQRFTESICAGLERADRCLAAGRLVEERSLGWLIFEACSAAGEPDTMARCFDRAHLLAAQFTGDARYEENYRHCNRLQGDFVDQAKVLCYRADFKYANHNRELRGRFEKGSGR
jgi:hypothetical protein